MIDSTKAYRRHTGGHPPAYIELGRICLREPLATTLAQSTAGQRADFFDAIYAASNIRGTEANALHRDPDGCGTVHASIAFRGDKYKISVHHNNAEDILTVIG